MEAKKIDFTNESKLQIACEDFIEEFKTKFSAGAYSLSSSPKMLNLCFAVLWVFLNKLVEPPNQP